MTEADNDNARSVASRLGQVGVWLAALGSVPAQRARTAMIEIEELGYGAVWIGEAPTTKEVFTHAGLLLAASKRIVVATGIANIWVRDATAMNAAANTLGEAYPNRFVLGLGASHAAATGAGAPRAGRTTTPHAGTGRAAGGRDALVLRPARAHGRSA